MDEEAQKRSTDCVYFLASPLTCKKGNSCEFRHSKAARLNPRDCWYWVHKTCLNPQCAFRHPPIEGKSVSLPPLQEKGAVTDTPRAPATSVAPLPATALSNKSKTPCYFFSQGTCAKGNNCPYMHLPRTQTSQQEATSQQSSKPPPGEASQVISKPVLVLKGDIKKQAAHESSGDRSVSSHNEAPPIPPPLKSVVMHTKEAPQMQKDAGSARILESSATSIASQHKQVSSGSRKTRISKFSDTLEEYQDAVDMLCGTNDLAEISQQGRPAWKQQQQESHQERESSQWRGVFNQRDGNGTRSEEWLRNEASFVEGKGSDQSNQREDGEYSPRFDSRGRSKDDSAGSGFKSLPSHQHVDNRYKQHQEPRTHQQQPEYNGMVKHPPRVYFPSRPSSSIRDGERMVPEGYINTVDLRNHLKKRQRDDLKGQPINARIRERLWHTENPLQQKHNGRETYRRETADYRGLKRQCHDGRSPGSDGLHHWPSHHVPGRSPERVSYSHSPNRHDYVRGEAIDQGREGYASRVGLASDSRSQIVVRKGPITEHTKEDSDFTGPKSLAQIKAEKMGEGSRVKADANARVEVSIAKREHTFGNQSVFSKDFEGPKPLKKEKRMVEPKVLAQDSAADPNKAENSREDRAREVEDGELRCEDNDWNEGWPPFTDLPVVPVQEELASRLPADANIAPQSGVALNYAQEAEDNGLGSSEDLSRLDEDMGPALSGEEDYELDEDDEVVATRLGGFFS